MRVLGRRRRRVKALEERQRQIAAELAFGLISPGPVERRRVAEAVRMLRGEQ